MIPRARYTMNKMTSVSTTGLLCSLLLYIICNNHFVTGAVSCKNHVGRSVDWFALYKLPKTKPNIRNFKQLYGHEMAYYDSESRKKTWNLLRNSIYETIGNPIYNTLKPMYTERKRVAYLAYNDQVPKNFSGVRKGHSKGVLMAANDGSGSVVWLQHSVPQFVPDVRYGYAYPTSGRENGQLFLCLSMPLRFLDIIDIYTDELKNTVNDSIFVQSWRNGNGGAQDKSCHSKYQVTDVQTLLIHTENGQLFFSSSEDHSKWSVTRTKSVFCFSSLNRMKSQGSRGGEITCLFDVRMATLFKKSIANRTKCSNDKGE
ncbi:cell-death-related nuclease 7-like isoform X3 [Rhipicephalus microplus]|uniref:cell-death-related nuclease 7-like isoform X3 n=1 Tax=Rhipicephalus microplus TaxID=6941 RepID=UPI003F6CD68D